MMNIIIGPRRSGKTFKLMQQSAKDGGIIVCHSKQEAQRIIEMANEFSYDIPDPVTYSEFLGYKLVGKNIPCVHIDNLDMFLSSISRFEIGTGSVSFDSLNSIENLAFTWRE